MTRFLDAGAPVSQVKTCTRTDKHGTETETYTSCEVLGTAVEKGLEDMVRLLLAPAHRDQIDPNATDSISRGILGFAMKAQHVRILRMLLEAGADANGFTRPVDCVSTYGPDGKRERLLIRALQLLRESSGAVTVAAAREIVHVMLEKGADPRFDINDGAPLVWAVKAGNIDAVRVLLEHPDAFISTMARQELESGDTAFTAAVALGSLEMLSFVTESLDLPLNPETVAAQYKHQACPSTLLTIAVSSRCAVMVRTLITASAPLNAQDYGGLAALAYAVFDESEDVVRVLLDAGADIHLADKRGETPLHRALENRSTDLIALLLDAGACPHPRSADERGTHSLGR
ncbi:ankyrin repeat-containing domain protein [Aspergillus multicolor]|uniref:ankyrin repeat-containing domain protein n=1 Tax=Aspergillus multicolor TaxID=41759 RepID=UPI003CCD1163